MKGKFSILDSPFLYKERNDSKMKKIISNGSIFVSSILIIQNILYLFYWNLATSYFGKGVFEGLPKPNKIPSYLIEGNSGLKEIVEDGYELVSISLLPYFLLFFTLFLFQFLILIIQTGKKRIIIFSFGMVAAIFTIYILGSDLISWILG